MKAVAFLSTCCAACVGLTAVVGGTAAPGPCQSGDTLVSIRGFAFSPSSVTVAPGATVCWTNQDGTTHTVTSDAAGAFDSGPLANDESFRHTFGSEGSFPYDCAVPGHYMPGSVTVAAAPPPPPPP
ncbi:MAG: plastocyanin/azurin family copper-binding protein, partial [Gaiellaceae bacterium]